jgi:hypothetical protein
MNTIRLVFYTILLVAFVSGCQRMTPQPETDARNTNQTVSETGTENPGINALLPVPGAESMKGYELYSWKEDGQWYFSVLIGTNREKTLQEIQAPEARLKGLEELQPLLESIPAGQYMTWLSRQSLAFPPEETLKHVQEICQRQGLELGIIK